LNWLNKLPGFQRAPYGAEVRLLRLIPTMVVAGTLLPALASVAARWLIEQGSAAEMARSIQMFDFYMVALVIFIWTLILTLGIFCTIVWLMKGPAYVADGFEVSHRDTPAP
jgi:hypothetical protein